MRKKLTLDQEHELQIPVLQALESYFDAVYSSDASFCSVGCGATGNKPDTVLVFSAFRVPREQAEYVREFITSQADQFADGMTTINDAPDFSNSTH